MFERKFHKTLIKTLTYYLKKKLVKLQTEKSITNIFNMKRFKAIIIC